MKIQWQNPLGIKERIIVRGTLFLETPTHVGNGDVDGPTDMPLLLDPLENRALLPGTSLAGALRNYMRARDVRLAEILFGEVRGQESHPSPLIVDDALGAKPRVELRDGVAIDPQTRTALPDRKFDMELLEAGVEFPLSFELLLPEQGANNLLRAFALALHGLENGEIRLGKRKRRGFGRCRVKDWCVDRYEVSTPAGMIAWLECRPSDTKRGPNIAPLLGVCLDGLEEPASCRLTGTFTITGSLLIRSKAGEPNAPDFVHLRSRRHETEVPVVSGTSLAGAIRARALRIANTMHGSGPAIIENLFGNADKTGYKASRLWFEESVIDNCLDLVQSRIKIDRFTGGAYPGALFSEQPVFGRLACDSTVRLNLEIQQPTDSEIGLLLLLLKDLWTGDLPLGGESAVGRGRLKGKEAVLRLRRGKVLEEWAFLDNNGKLEISGDKDKLELFVKAFTGGNR